MSDLLLIDWSERTTPTGPSRLYGCRACGAALDVSCTAAGFTDAAAWIKLHGGRCGEKKLGAAMRDVGHALTESLARVLRIIAGALRR